MQLNSIIYMSLFMYTTIQLDCTKFNCAFKNKKVAFKMELFAQQIFTYCVLFI